MSTRCKPDGMSGGRLKQQRLVVAHQKLIERHIEIWHERGHSEQVRRGLRDGRQGNQKRDGRLPPARQCVNERKLPGII